MPIDSARSYFEAVAKHGREPSLADAVGVWESQVDGAGTWRVFIDHGALTVSEVPPGTSLPPPTIRVRLSEREFLRLARGEDHQNLLTALLRGALALEGKVAFGARLTTLLPLPEPAQVQR